MLEETEVLPLAVSGAVGEQTMQNRMWGGLCVWHYCYNQLLQAALSTNSRRLKAAWRSTVNCLPFWAY